ncbi:MAG TPA: hypothetical protein VMW87_12315 [Spirochaetia bacterium]|nr:hypothetical protein [Spirochaetia bacterium]
MAGKNRNDADRIRKDLLSAVGNSLGSGTGGYSLSSSVTDPQRKKLFGLWRVEEHLVGESDYIEHFSRSTLNGRPLLNPQYLAEYEFRPAVCLKRVDIIGILDIEGREVPYSYRMRLALTWEIGSGVLKVQPELGYQYSSVDGVASTVRDFYSSPPVAVVFVLKDQSLVLEEGGDRKILRRIS